MSTKDSNTSYDDKKENQLKNMRAIVAKLTGDDSEAKRVTVNTAATKLEQELKRIRENNGGGSGHSKLMDVLTDGTKAHATFAREVKDVRDYLEKHGFTKLQEKLYTKREIEELVQPINEGK